jgi:hypothetical protein
MLNKTMQPKSNEFFLLLIFLSLSIQVYLATGDWRLATGDWRLATGDWRLATNFLLFLSINGILT